VGDDDQRDTEPVGQALHQFQDLRLDRHVERGGRLVGDDQLRVAGQCDRDHDALAHAARQLVRVLLEAALGIGNADQAQEFDGTALRRGRVGAAMLLDRLGDLAADRQDRVQRGHRLLENHADLAAAHLPHLFFRQAHQVAAGEQHLARGDAAPADRE
jgi:serine kinase of HPr protein (carbohydrate metabolism regulator)